MDISMPIPDIPALEPFRQFDPVTRGHDTQTGREPYFWLNMSRAVLLRFSRTGNSIIQATS